MFAIDYRLPAAYDYSYPNISINMQYSLGSPVTLVRLALFCSLPLGHPSQGRGTHGKNAPRARRAPRSTRTYTLELQANKSEVHSLQEHPKRIKQ